MQWRRFMTAIKEQAVEMIHQMSDDKVATAD
jgi:hypothetical protein